MVAEAEAIVRAEGSIWTTDSARSLGAAGVISPGHAIKGLLQELGRPPSLLPLNYKYLAEEVAGGRGKPEIVRDGLGRSRTNPWYR